MDLWRHSQSIPAVFLVTESLGHDTRLSALHHCRQICFSALAVFLDIPVIMMWGFVRYSLRHSSQTSCSVEDGFWHRKSQQRTSLGHVKGIQDGQWKRRIPANRKFWRTSSWDVQVDWVACYQRRIRTKLLERYLRHLHDKARSFFEILENQPKYHRQRRLRLKQFDNIGNPWKIPFVRFPYCAISTWFTSCYL